LGSWHSTTELRPQVLVCKGLRQAIWLSLALVVPVFAEIVSPKLDCSGWHPTGQDKKRRAEREEAADHSVRSTFCPA
jgi:hypothetical protein